MPQFYSVASTVDDTLRQQREEQRQATLDALRQKDVESQIAARDEAAKMSALQRKLQTGEIFLKQFGIGQDASPEAYQQAKELGVGNAFSEAKPAMGASFEGPMPTGETPVQAQKGSASKFLGTPEEQAAARSESQFANLMNSGWFEDENVSPLEKAMAAKKLAGLTLPSEFFKPKAGPGHVWVFDEASGKITQAPGVELPPGMDDKIITRNRPPQGPAPEKPILQKFTDKDGKERFSWLYPGQTTAKEITGIDAIDPSMVKKAGAGGGEGGVKPVDTALSKAYADALGDVAASSGAAWYQSSKPNKVAMAKAASLRQAIANHGVTPKAQALIRNALVAVESNPQLATKNTPDVLAASLDDSYTPEEKASVIGILSQVRGR